MKKGVRVYIDDVLECIDKIEEHTEGVGEMTRLSSASPHQMPQFKNRSRRSRRMSGSMW